MERTFRRFAQRTSEIVGSSWSFIVAVVVIVGWGISGPLFHFSDTWQLVINTGTTIVTFLMVFLIQNTQNRETAALHLKLDELIRSNVHARNKLLDLENLSDDELKRLQEEFRRLRDQYGEAADERVDELSDELDGRRRSAPSR